MEFRQRYLLNHPGFSLIEVLLVMGVMGILAAMSISGLVATRHRASINREASTTEVVVRQAQQRAQTARDGRSWGVRCAGDQLQMFSYTETLVTDEEVTKFQANVRCQTAEVRFQKLSGVPQAPVNFILEDNSRAFKQVQVELPGLIVLTTV